METKYDDTYVVYLGWRYRGKSANKSYYYHKLGGIDDVDLVEIDRGELQLPERILNFDGVVYFDKLMTGSAKPGDVYVVGTINDTNTWRGDNPIEDCRKGAIVDEQVQRLLAIQRGIKLQRMREKEAKKEQTPTLDLEALAPFREAYQQMTFKKRAVILANVIEYITRM